jgi:hypothetical protein
LSGSWRDTALLGFGMYLLVLIEDEKKREDKKEKKVEVGRRNIYINVILFLFFYKLVFK